MRRRIMTCAVLASLLGASLQADTSVFFYAGQLADGPMREIFSLRANFRPSWVGVAGITRKLTDLGPHAHFEGELQVGQHWGRQSHPEVNAVLTARWNRFPWDERFNTSFAFGAGYSYAARPPPLEARHDQDASRLLKYLLVELEVALPRHPQWRPFLRVHHRSGAFGLVADTASTNFFGVGLRRRI